MITQMSTIQKEEYLMHLNADGLLVEYIEEKESEYNLGIIVQKTNETIKYTYVWKLL
mgnify:CR=1 FL=1